MAKFVKQGNFGYKEVQGGERSSEYENVILTRQEYETTRQLLRNSRQTELKMDEWRQKYWNLKDTFEICKKKLENLEQRETIQEGMVAIPESALNGYKKAVRIVRDRARQQVDKAKADKYGYTLLRADKRKYKASKRSAWLITRSTPYSIKMSLDEAYAMIGCDLVEYYGFRELPVLKKNGYSSRLEERDLLDYYKRFYELKEDISRMHNEEILWALAWLNETNGKVAFEISHIAQNVATGCYEVSYWATSPM